MFVIKFWRGWWLVLSFYILLYGLLLWQTNGVPYAMDNNESFCSLVHAQNLIQYGVKKSKGLTDETSRVGSNTESAHPFVHTHQGNFPRLYAALLFYLGATSMEQQIVITTFTVGLLGLFLTYSFFAQLTTPLVAAVTMGFMITDYILFSQWQVNTYRVWYPVFFFGVLTITQKFDHWPRWVSIISNIIIFSAIFYGEFVFASFCMAMGCVYCILLYPQKRRNWIGYGCSAMVGATIAISVLFIQLIAYMGWDNVVTDIRYTIGARNYAQTDVVRQQIETFYSQNKILFLPNYFSNDNIRTGEYLLTILPRFIFPAFSPLLVLCTFLLTNPLLILFLINRYRMEAWAINKWKHSELKGFALNSAIFRDRINSGGSRKFLSILSKGFILFGGTFWLLYCGLANQAAWGLRIPPYSRSALPSPIALLVSGCLAVLFGTVILKLINGWKGLGKINWVRCLIILADVLLLSYYARVQGDIYPKNLQPIWVHMANSIWGIVLGSLLYICASCLFLLTLWKGRLSHVMMLIKILKPVLPIFGASLAGLLVAWIWSAGYLHSGYLGRFCPFFHYPIYLIFGSAIVVAMSWFSFFKRQDSIFANNKIFLNTKKMKFLSMACCLLLVATWAYVQILYINALPPNYFSFLKYLKNSNGGFVTNQYATPVAQITQSWAYMLPDPDLTFNNIEGLKNLEKNYIYMFFGDRRENPIYEKPNFYLYIEGQYYFSTIADRLRQDEPGKQVRGYEHDGIVMTALQQQASPYRHRIVALDSSPRKSWAIVALDTEAPPQLLSNQGAQSVRQEIAAEAMPYRLMRVGFEFTSQNMSSSNNSFIIERILIDGKQVDLDNQFFDKNQWENLSKNLLYKSGLKCIASHEAYFNLEVSGYEAECQALVRGLNGLFKVWIGSKAYFFSISEKSSEKLDLKFDLKSNDLLSTNEFGQSETKFVGLRIIDSSKNGIKIIPDFKISENSKNSQIMWCLYRKEIKTGEIFKLFQSNNLDPCTLMPEKFNLYAVSVVLINEGKSSPEYISDFSEIKSFDGSK